MYKLSTKSTFVWPVKVSLASDGGGFEVRTIHALFKRLPTEHVHAIQQQFEADGDQRAMLAQLVAGWEKQDLVLDANDQPAAFCPEAFDFALSTPGVAVALMQAYSEAYNGGLIRKN